MKSFLMSGGAMGVQAIKSGARLIGGVMFLVALAMFGFFWSGGRMVQDGGWKDVSIEHRGMPLTRLTVEREARAVDLAALLESERAAHGALRDEHQKLREQVARLEAAHEQLVEVKQEAKALRSDLEGWKRHALEAEEALRQTGRRLAACEVRTRDRDSHPVRR